MKLLTCGQAKSLDYGQLVRHFPMNFALTGLSMCKRLCPVYAQIYATKLPMLPDLGCWALYQLVPGCPLIVHQYNIIDLNA